MKITFWILLFCFLRISSSTLYKFEDSKAPCHPCNVHISYGDTTSDMTVIWATQENCNSTVSYGTDPWNYGNIVPAEMTHFDKPTKSGLQCVYKAQMKNLQLNTTYFYRPTSNNISSGPHFFKTPAPDQSTEFLICGDHSIESDSIPFLDTEVLSGQYDAVLHVGEFTQDLINDVDGQSNDEDNSTTCYPQSGDVFMTLMSNMASRVPYMTTPGDHIKGDLFSHYRHWFSMPGTPWPMPLDKLWYSFEIGSVHFISYSTEVFFLENTQYANEQNVWLKSDLETVNRTAFPWIIAFGHLPMYCSQNSEEDCGKPDSKVRQGLEDLFFIYGVDVIIQAHGKLYERLYPQYKGVVLNTDYSNPKGPVQLITGSTKTADGQTQSTGAANKWSAVRLGDEGRNSFTRLKVYNTTHLSWQQISAKSQSVLDSIWITQEIHGRFLKPETIATQPPIVHINNVDNNVNIPSKETDISSSWSNTANNPTSSSAVNEFFTHTSNKILIGVGVGVITLALITSIIIIVKRKQRIRSYRRWDATVDYGRKFYSAYSQVGKEDKDGSDFEVDSSEGNPSSKLLSDRPS